MIKHGGVYVRVHPCRVMHENETYSKPSPKKSTLDTKRGENGSSETEENSDLECNVDFESDSSDINNSAPIISETNNRSNEKIFDGNNDDCDHDSNDSDTTGNFDLNNGGIDHNENETVVQEMSSVLENINADHSESEGMAKENSSVLKSMENKNADHSESIVLKKASADGSTGVKLRKDLDIRYRSDNARDWTQAKVHSRAGKATGKFKDHWNVLENGKIKEVNFKNCDWRLLEDNQNEEVLLCETFLSKVDEKIFDAKRAEIENWKREMVYEEVEDCGQETVSVRWVVTQKLVEDSWITKARLVARGFEEDKSELRTDSPTCMRETLKICLAIAASNNWNINSIDIKAAFLQGKAIDRDVYLAPPKEFRNEGKIWHLKKVVYGLSDASRVWYVRVVDELLSIGCKLSQYDKALFKWMNGPRTEGILVLHVDDFLWCGSEKFRDTVIHKLRNIFRISKENVKTFKYLGIKLKQSENRLIVSQKNYTDTIEQINIRDIPRTNLHTTVDAQPRKKN